MASYYPEGECYFVRSSLRLPNNWNANNRNNFYSHILVEYYWNGWTATSTQSRSHRRSSWRHGTPSGINNTRFGDWDRFWVGESRDKNPEIMTAMHSHPNSLNWNECRDLNNGGPRKYILRPIQIQSRETEWLWIDGTIPIRAVYFPVAQQTDQAFANLCTYVVIDFRHREEIDIMDYRGFNFNKFRVTSHAGLGWRESLTWGFHMPDIIAYLTIPHKLRNPDQRLFKAKDRRDDLVVCASSSITWRSSSTVIHHPDFFRQIDFADVLSATFGVEVGWRPYEPSNFLRNLIIDLVNLGLGFIPGVGPILSVAFGIAVQLLEDPKSFSHENILDLNQAIMDNVTRSANKHRKYLAPGFMGKGRGRQELVPLSDDERASRQKYGEELNEKLTKELNPQVVIRSLLDQELLLYGAASLNGVGEEEQTEVQTISIDAAEEEKETVEGDESKKDE
ncbi:hypothetical protein FPSE_08269 [Fusarium pseudograminearum CS3096]|uniref:Uncharacterized protein n=1 Tax=Fusarium pseudograminearum (strain CS3096) TaxID=1028729 RepID=K3VFD8_FUSPC|nr:hypothetical protein FPSE_08269 [Fusarium pseudograminearum CS3096]EKJ71528.1 hypothetical protein FPSE_08269 [Fusarium pseudograminearum CS3096]